MHDNETALREAITRSMQYRRPPIVENASRYRRILNAICYSQITAVALLLILGAVLID